MAQRPTADFNIDPNITSGTDLANILNRFQDAIDSGNSGASRPAYLAAGGLWVREGDPMRLYLYDGTTDRELYNTTDGLVGASQWVDNDDGIYYVDGVVGVGTAYPNPASPLTVSDNGDMGFEFRPNEGRILFYNRDINDYAPAVLTCSAFDVVDGGLGVTTLQITDDGDCGIGRPDPQARLDVQGPGNSVVAYFGGSGDASPNRSLAIAGSDNDLTYTLDSTGDGSNGKLAFATNGSQHVTIDNIGRVGIGGTPSRSTKEIEEEAEATLANWKSQLDERLKAEPKADKKAVTQEITGHDKMPTKAELVERLTERNIGGGDAKLQVAGDISCNSTIFSPGNAGIRFYGSTGGPYIGNAVIGTNTAGVATTDLVDIGTPGTKFRDAHFSGDISSRYVDVTGQVVGSSGRTGIAFSSGLIYPCVWTGSTPAGANSTVDFGSASYKWKDGHFSGAVYSSQAAFHGGSTTRLLAGSEANNIEITFNGMQPPGMSMAKTTGDTTFRGTVDAGAFTVNGAPLTRVSDIIETFRTLKNAVSDETTVEGIKEALTNSLGGLIEKFEAMQSAATQEIES